MLLTSGQVSIAISSFVVFLFTTALFLSGYVLQQQTVRDLRAAIKPEMHRIFVHPELDTERTTGKKINADGGTMQNNEALVEVTTSSNESEENYNNNIMIQNGGSSSSQQKQTNPRHQQRQRPTQNEAAVGNEKPGKQRILVGDNDDVESVSEAVNPVADADADPPRQSAESKPISKAERRQKIREQILADGEGDGFKGYRRRMW